MTHLEHTNGYAHRHTGAALGALVVCDRPRVTLELLQDASELELALADGQKEAARAERAACGVRWALGLAGCRRAWGTRSHSARSQTKHLRVEGAEKVSDQVRAALPKK